MYIYKDILGRFLNKSFTDGLGLCPCSLYPPRLGVGTLQGRGLVRVCLSRNGGNSRVQLSSRVGIPLTTHYPEAPPMKVPFFSLCQTSEWGTLLSIVYPHFWLGATPQMVPCMCWVQAPRLGRLLLSLVQTKFSAEQDPRGPHDSKGGCLSYAWLFRVWGCRIHVGLGDRLRLWG